MRLIAFAAVSALALSAGACAPRIDYAHKTTLDCPDRQGELRLTSVAADKKSCTYHAEEGAEITLQLASVNGDAGAVLSALETQLTGPEAPGAAPKAEAEKDKPARAAPASAAGASDAARAAQEASADASAGGAGKSDWDDKDSVKVGHNDRGEVSVRDNAHVSLPGLHIDADDNNARVDIAGVHIDANDSEQTVHVVRDVRLRGYGFSQERNGLRATFIARRDNLPDGYRFVGYQAGGPKTGPLTVAVVKSRDELSDGGRLYRDIQRLVRRNSGA
jgi:hypothetical protein